MGDSQRTVIVAVIAVRVMEVSIDEVVDVIPVGDRFMTTTVPVNVGCVVSLAGMGRGAVGGVLSVHLDLMLVDVIAVRVVQVPVVQIVDVVAVLHRNMTAVGIVGVFVIRVFLAAHS